MKFTHLSRRLSKRTISMGIIGIFCLELVIGGIFSAILPTNVQNQNNTLLNETNNSNNSTTGNGINSTQTGEKYKTYVESNLPNASVSENQGYWLKGDPTVHTSDGDFNYLGTHIGQNTESVDQLSQMALNNGLDFIGITNIDQIKYYAVLLGTITINANLGATYGAVTTARTTYANTTTADGHKFMIFYGVEKTIGAANYFGLGKHIQCLLPYNPNSEWSDMQSLLTESSVSGVLGAMQTFPGLSGEKGSTMYSVNTGTGYSWSASDYSALAQSSTAGGVVSVTGSTVNNFVQFSTNPSSSQWDYYLGQGDNFFGAAGSDYYTSGSGGPGAITKTYVKVYSPGYAGLMEGFKYGRVFTAQNNIISGLELSMSDNYNNIAYMGDTLVSYGNETVNIDVQNNVPIQDVKLITNYGGHYQIYKDFTSGNYDTSTAGHIKMSITMPSSNTSYYIRVMGTDANGNSFFSAPIFYQKSNIIMPTIHITNPPVDNYHTTQKSIDLTWDQSSGLGKADIYQWSGYQNPSATSTSQNAYYDSHQACSLNINLVDGWNTIMVVSYVSNEQGQFLANDVVHIFCSNSTPAVNILSPLNNSYTNNHDVNITWNAEAPSGFNIDNFSVWIDNNAKITGLSSTTNSYVFSNIAQGIHTYHVQVFQNINYESSTSNITVYNDYSPPTLTINNPTNGTIFNETSSSLILMNFTAQDQPVYGCLDHFSVNITKDGKTYQSDFLSSNAVNYTLPNKDGQYWVNLTVYDKAGNQVSESLHYYVDLLPPIFSLPSIFYSSQNNVHVTWSDYDTSTWVDGITMEFTNGTVIHFNNQTTNYNFWSPKDGVYNFQLTATDSQGHAMTRFSEVVIDHTPAMVYSIWIEDNFFNTTSSYFKIGMIASDNISGLQAITLHYSLFTNNSYSYNGTITQMMNGQTQSVMEIPESTISSMVQNYQCNISFYFDVENNVNLTTQTKTYEHQMKLIVTIPPKSLTSGEIIAITAGVMAAAVVVGFIVYRVRKNREYGDLSKYF